MTTHLDKEELELAASIERGEWRSVKNLEAAIKEAKAYARATMTKNARMNIRISKRDLNDLKAKALEEGVPYQTLVSSILHKYVAGKLAETN